VPSGSGWRKLERVADDGGSVSVVSDGVGELAFSPARFHGGMYLVGAAVPVEVDMVVEGTLS
jgi:hypothetical protein